MINAVQVQKTDGKLVSLRGNDNVTAQATGVDGFAAIFQNMASLDLQAVNATGKKAEQKSQQSLMEQIASMLLANPALAQHLSDMEQSAQAMQTSQLLQVLEQKGTLSVQGLTQMLEQLASATPLTNGEAAGNSKAVTGLTQLFAQLNGTVVPQEDTGELPVTQVTTGNGFAQGEQQDSMKQLFFAQQQVRSAISAVKSSNEKPLELEINVDQLQGQVNLNRIDGMQVVKLQGVGTQTTAEPQLLTQLTQGIPPKLTTGEGEFVMKLNPNSLGEITVRFMEKDGKTAVTILTANNQTAKLINAEIVALRDALRPMQVEVRDAILETTETPQGQMNFDMAGQQFSDKRQAFENARQVHTYYPGNVEPEAEQVEVQQEAPTGMLNIRI